MRQMTVNDRQFRRARRTILRVTVPTPAEFSEMTPSFSGFFFIS
jgi:hypothetical protein